MPSSPGSGNLHPLIARIADHACAIPDAVALVCDGSNITYRELWQRAIDLARDLKNQGMQPGDRIALAGERTVQQFVNLLAVLVAGGIYVPLGEKAPPDRRAAIAADAGARFSLSDSRAEIVTRNPGAPPGAIDLPPGYILYTSGSTGVPKGVQVTLDNVSAYIENVQRFYPIANAARAAQIADLAFDASVHEMFGAWSAGATLCVVPARQVLMWPRYFRDLGMETALLVPSQVRLAHRAGLLKRGSLPALRRIFLGAELVTGEVVRLLQEAAPNCGFVNLWGPTEGTVALTHYPIQALPADHEGIPIGQAWPDHRVMLEDEADGIGEMTASGPQICRSYWNLPAADAERFFSRDGAIFYRTGDLARLDAAQGLIFMGRRDRQVKIKGYRIELEECERAIRRRAGTGQAFVIAQEGRLVCFIEDGVAIDTLEAGLRDDLPGYMIPTHFIAISTFPLTQSAKVDINRLRAMLTDGSQGPLR